MFLRLTMSLVGYSLVEFRPPDLLDLVVSSACLLDENGIIAPPAAALVVSGWIDCALVVLPTYYEAIHQRKQIDKFK